MEDFRAHPHGLREACRADRHDHEFLEVDRIVGMRPAIDDVHHRHGEQGRPLAPDVSVERQILRGRFGLGGRERDAENGVGAEALLVFGSVEIA